MSFISPKGCYCYTQMPFGLRNAGATFQRAMQASLGSQLGRNVEAYIDDIVVKTRYKDSLSFMICTRPSRTFAGSTSSSTPTSASLGYHQENCLASSFPIRESRPIWTTYKPSSEWRLHGESRMSNALTGASSRSDGSSQGLENELCLYSSFSRSWGPYS